LKKLFYFAILELIPAGDLFIKFLVAGSLAGKSCR
jgi:hypothetical protein